jgi:hypothetical protein
MEVVFEGMQDEGREGDRAPAGFGLGGSEHPTQPSELMGLALHGHGAVGRDDVPALQAKQFTAPHAGEAAEEHEASEPGLDRFGEVQNRRRVEHRAFMGMLDAGAPDGARVATDHPIGKSGVQNRPQQSVAGAGWQGVTRLSVCPSSWGLRHLDGD